MACSHFIVFLCAISYASTFLKPSHASDNTLFPNQTIVNGQTLISQNQMFETGFFALGTSGNGYFFGTRYRNTPDVVFWVANRNNPVTDPQGALLTIAGNGTLVIRTRGNVIWSSNSTGVASSPVLQLLETGNLVIVESESGRQSGSYLWQSYDDPCDTRVPGMKMVDDVDGGVEKHLTSWRSYDDPSPGDSVYRIVNRGLPELVLFRGRSKKHRSGIWNGRFFDGLPSFPNPMYNPDLTFDGERMISMVEPYKSSVFSRVRLEPSGLLQRYTMNGRRDSWNLVTTFPQDPCDNYGQCGPNGICRTWEAPMCECLKGFVPRSQTEWDIQQWAGGCTWNETLNCMNGDGFVEVRGVKYPELFLFRLNTSMSLGDCRDECLRNCNCTAYASAFITDGGSGCLMWLGDLVDIRDLSGVDENQNIYVRVPNSELVRNDARTDLEQPEQRRPRKLILIISTISGALVILGGLIGAALVIKRQRRKAAKRENEDFELPLFKFATIAAATNNFSSRNIIGEGGFGPVYKGNFSAEEEIAVKRLSKASGQGLDEFKTEVSLIAKLQHRNLVQLLGCCIEGEEMMLIYEFLQNKSLDYFIFDRKRRALLTWPKRFDIIMGIARGLLYLHHDSRLKIIHRDLKTSNILLDGDLNPKISDFGLARIFYLDQTIARTKRVVGTYGYMAPEYAFDGKYSIKSDIFSLGVVLLEIVSGKRNRRLDQGDYRHSLLGHAWLLWKENRIMELMDDSFNDSFVESQVKRCIQVGLLCVQRFAEDRPVMSSVLFMLGNDEAILPEPKEPGFFIGRSSSHVVRRCSTVNNISGKLTITITELVAR